MSPLFALSFGVLSMLGGLALAAAPIIIHLLSRRRYKECEWAAMQWLLAALKKNARRIQLEQIILLAVRTLLVVCVVLAMAKPFLEGAGVPLLPGKRAHRIVVMDGSFSMAYRATGRDRFERAKEVALAILSDARKGDVASLVLMAAPPRAVVGEPSANLAAVADEVKSLELPHGGADLAATLAKLDEILAASNIEQKEIYFITDLQRASWSPGPAGGSASLVDLAAKIGSRANLVLIDLGQGSSDNVAVTSFGLDEPFATTDRGIRFTATLRNFGRSNRNSLVVMLAVDGAVQDRRTIDLPAGEQNSLVLTHNFATPAWHSVEVAVEDDALPVDNHRWVVVEVKEFVDVLLVDGEPSAERFGNETDYLRVALAPESSAAEAKSPIRPEVVRESDFLEVDLARFDAVLFANIGQFTESEAGKIDGYLRRGGSVVWFLGDHVDGPSYNRVLYRDGRGVLPVPLGVRVGDAKQRQSSIRFDPRDYAHPIIQPFRGAAAGGLATTQVFEYVRVELPAESNARVALEFEGGDPVIVTSDVHRGRVAVVTTAADIEWSGWPWSPSYVPVMNELVNFVVADRDREHQMIVGDSLIAPVPAVVAEVPVTVELPDRRAVPRRLTPRDEVSYFVFDQTWLSGSYRVNFGPPLATEQLFAVNVDSKESDLAKLEADELRDLLPGCRFQYLTNWQAIAAGKTSVTHGRGELHRYLLYAALALAFLESFLAYKFGHYS